MALENIQYDAIMREYDRRQSHNRRQLEVCQIILFAWPGR